MYHLLTPFLNGEHFSYQQTIRLKGKKMNIENLTAETEINTEPRLLIW
jgi:hypothetical protein